MQETIPTPGPWIIRRDTIGVGDERGMQKHIAHMAWDDEQGKADARHIVECVNSHDTLKARIAELEAALREAWEISDGRSVMLQIGIERIDAALKEPNNG